MDVKNKLLDLSENQERIFEELLRQILNISLKGLNETLNEVNRLQRRHSSYDFSFYQIQNLKTNINSIQEQYDTKIRIMSYDIKEQLQSTKEILSDPLNQLIINLNIEEKKTCLNELINQIDHLFQNISYQLSLKSIYSTVGIFSSIESIIALFTGTGVLGIAPLRMTFVINSTSSEMMFRDKLEELNQKLRWIIENIPIKTNEQLQYLNLYFNHFKMTFSP